MRVYCTAEDTYLDGEYGQPIESVEITCGSCHHTTVSYGTSSRSVNRCLVLLREECPRGQRNFYVASDH